MDKLFIVMPAYNEAENIEETINQWYPVVEQINSDGNECFLVIADDGSKDDTYEKMCNLKAEKNFFIPLTKANSGHGATVMFLYEYAIEQGADFVFQTDSDGQTLPDEFWQMWQNRTLFDFQIGTRGGRQDGFGRVAVTKVLRLVVRIMFGVWVKDANTPFRLMKTERLCNIVKYIPQGFFLVNVAVSTIAVKKKERVAWYPITFRPRQGGVNSINMKRIVKIGCKALSDFRKINKAIQYD
ncbi:MAG: glycosyltransferase family 2 protein [Bacteroidales bacterium]|nr:glycosyltransferase family 2 protein [Bacteroidales bacterium]